MGRQDQRIAVARQYLIANRGRVDRPENRLKLPNSCALVENRPEAARLAMPAIPKQLSKYLRKKAHLPQKPKTDELPPADATSTPSLDPADPWSTLTPPRQSLESNYSQAQPAA